LALVNRRENAAVGLELQETPMQAEVEFVSEGQSRCTGEEVFCSWFIGCHKHIDYEPNAEITKIPCFPFQREFPFSTISTNTGSFVSRLELTAQALRTGHLELPLAWEAQRRTLEFARPA